jgi:hypothetical protein
LAAVRDEREADNEILLGELDRLLEAHEAVKSELAHARLDGGRAAANELKFAQSAVEKQVRFLVFNNLLFRSIIVLSASAYVTPFCGTLTLVIHLNNKMEALSGVDKALKADTMTLTLIMTLLITLIITLTANTH